MSIECPTCHHFLEAQGRHPHPLPRRSRSSPSLTQKIRPPIESAHTSTSFLMVDPLIQSNVEIWLTALRRFAWSLRLASTASLILITPSLRIRVMPRAITYWSLKERSVLSAPERNLLFSIDQYTQSHGLAVPAMPANTLPRSLKD